MDNQNITLSVPKHVLRRIKIIAVRQGTSVSGLMTRFMEELVSREEGYQAAQRRYLDLLDASQDLGTSGRISWTRDELHER
jgi:hypothetical protein